MKFQTVALFEAGLIALIVTGCGSSTLGGAASKKASEPSCPVASGQYCPVTLETSCPVDVSKGDCFTLTCIEGVRYKLSSGTSAEAAPTELNYSNGELRPKVSDGKSDENSILKVTDGGISLAGRGRCDQSLDGNVTFKGYSEAVTNYKLGYTGKMEVVVNKSMKHYPDSDSPAQAPSYPNK